MATVGNGSSASPPPVSTASSTSRSRSHPIHIDTDDDDAALIQAVLSSQLFNPPAPTADVDDDDQKPDISENSLTKSASTPTTAKPASTTLTANTTAASASAPVKPKSTKVRPRSPSPSPPPPAPPPLETIRLEIRLGGPDNYEVDVRSLANATGQRQPTPPVVKRDTSDSEGDDDAPGHGKSGKSPKGKGKAGRKKNAGSEYYDVTDPFIDDSDLAIDERTYFAQTKQQGFYVSSGEVALLKDKTPKKPKSKKIITTILPPPPDSASGHVRAGPSKTSAISASTKKHEGTRDSPIALMSDGEDDKNAHGFKRKRSEEEGDGKKKKAKTYEVHPFHPDLEKAIEELKEAVAKESFEVKGKFPPQLKPILARVALKAVMLNEYDDNFFNLMPRIFPYNKFTMTKLIKRTIYQDHASLLLKRQDELLEELQVIAHEGFQRAQEEYQKNVTQWERRQERAKAEAEAGGSASADGTPHPSQPPTTQADDAGSGVEHDTPAAGANASAAGGAISGTGKKLEPPQRRYRLTDQMKSIIYNMVCISNECCRIENEKNSLEGSTLQVSEQGLRKVLYQKIVAAFPDGWMNSGHISREVSAIKKKLEKEAMEMEEED